jgi:hypothetical protein
LQLQQLGFPEAQDVERGALAAVMLRPLGRAALLGLRCAAPSASWARPTR